MVWSIAALIALIGLDQGLKYWTVTNLALGESLPLIPGVMQLTRLHNYGGIPPTPYIFLYTLNLYLVKCRQHHGSAFGWTIPTKHHSRKHSER